jgi:HK97 family phage major capsid protein
MSDNIKRFKARKGELVASAQKMLADCSADGFTPEQKTEYDALTAKIETVNESIAAAEAMAETERAEAASSVDIDMDRATVSDSSADPKKFNSFGEQLLAIAAAGANRGAAVDPRLKWEAAAGANESSPSEGGFLVQSDFSTQLLADMHDMGQIMSRVRRVPISTNANAINLPAVDESSRADGSRWGGVQSYWANEAATVTASKPKFRNMEMKLNKLFGLAYTTDELLADSVALESVMNTAFAEEMTFKAENAIINGTGAGQPLGVLNGGALVTVTPESGQNATVLRAANIHTMWSRMLPRARRNAIWAINQDLEPSLFPLTNGDGTAVQLMYQPPGSPGNPNSFGLLMGRPVIPVEYCATAGTVGDIILMDPQGYVMIDKTGVKQDTSMHVRFVYDEMTFRIILRLDGQPIRRVPLTPFKGSNTLSDFVGLGTRAV